MLYAIVSFDESEENDFVRIKRIADNIALLDIPKIVRAVVW
jgi:hypothetical protein